MKTAKGKAVDGKNITVVLPSQRLQIEASGRRVAHSCAARWLRRRPMA